MSDGAAGVVSEATNAVASPLNLNAVSDMRKELCTNYQSPSAGAAFASGEGNSSSSSTASPFNEPNFEAVVEAALEVMLGPTTHEA